MSDIKDICEKNASDLRGNFLKSTCLDNRFHRLTGFLRNSPFLFGP
jgi:hypothetical protein